MTAAEPPSPPAQRPLKAGFEIIRDSFFISLALTFVLALVRERDLTGLYVLTVLVEVFIYTYIIMLLAYETFERIVPLMRAQSSKVQWTVFVVGMVAISAVGSLAGSVALSLLALESAPVLTLFTASFKLCVIVSLMIGINEVAWDRLKSQLEVTQLKLRTEELERERALKLAMEARLGSLESRLHPHFLFNTLNSISSLIPSNPERAERMVERMASILRFTLDSEQGGLVTFSQEMKIVRDYLEIEQARLGGRLRWGLETHGDVENVKIPPLSIQTLVENSIKFAVAPNRDGGDVRVSADRNDGFLLVNVADTGGGFSLESAPSGHGLDILRSRLQVLFGDAAEMTVSRAEDWTTVSVKVPA
jgi:two-component system, LytTR family, sensor histidine kinase AlgZ